ncbi:MAG TPA: outer membrane protein assembly factor BamE [Noviherbaspirillum sp.]
MSVPFSRRDHRFAALFLVAATLLSGCAAKNPLIDEPASSGTESGVQTKGPGTVNRLLGALSPYRIDIQQGNFVSREMVSQLKTGMSREQVQFILGTPLLTDIFHANRWDYVFRLQKGSGAVISSKVAVFFEGDRLVKVDGGELPTEAEYLAFITGETK